MTQDLSDPSGETAGPPLVLLVDDEAAILRALQRELRGQPYEVIACDDPHEALETVRSRTVALILSDNRMPVMSGIDLLERVRMESPDTVRALLTGYAELNSVVQAVNRGEIHRYLSKPWQKPELLQCVADGLERWRLAQENRELTRALARQNDHLQRSNAELREQVTRDRLTGLYNRGEFQAHLERQIKLFRRERLDFCLAMGDVDDFKRINDEYGHPMGDAVLRSIAATLTNTLREEVDTAYRYGGEEFALILRATPQDGARVALERVLARIREQEVGDTAGRAVRVTMSFGYGVYTEGTGADAFLAAVDRALYEAKGAGKDRARPAADRR